MNRATFDAMVAQYAVKDVSGEGAVSWDQGAHCVMPEVVIGGKTVQDGTPTPDAPIMPTFSEGTEVVSRGKNLANVTNEYVSWGGNSTNTVVKPNNTAAYGHVRSALMCVSPGKTYTVSWKGTAGGLRYFWYSEKPVPNITVSFGGLYIPYYKDVGIYTITAPPNAVYLLFVFVIPSDDASTAPYDMQIEEGPTATDYEPYFDGGTAVAPQLLAIPGTEYRDTWNPQTGKGVRRVGKLVFDGTEKWDCPGTITEGYSSFRLLGVNGLQPSQPMCSHLRGFVKHYTAKPYIECLSVYPVGTHFQLIAIVKNNTANSNGQTDASEWKAYLAAQHAAGTPVTVWYALAEPIPFQTDPQPLIQPKGTGQIIQTGGSLDGCPVSAKVVTHS